MSYRLYRNGAPASKAHSTRLACVIEAFERKIIVQWRSGRCIAIADGWEIRKEPGK